MSEPATVLIGESFIGEAAEAAHLNVVLGDLSGSVGIAWATALARPGADGLAARAVPRNPCSQAR